MKASRKQTRVELTASKLDTFCFIIYSVLCLRGHEGHEMLQKEKGPSRLSLPVTTKARLRRKAAKEGTLGQICRSIVLNKISCIKTCWWAQSAAIMTSLVSFPPPRTGCGEGRSKRMFSLPRILLLQSSMF